MEAPVAAVTELVAISQLLNLLIRIVPVRSHLAQPQKEIVESSFGEDPIYSWPHLFITKQNA